MHEHCCKNVNFKRFLVAFVAVFIATFIVDFLVHGLWLAADYEATANLWRSPEDMKAMMPWMVLGQAIGAFFLTLIFTKGYEGKGIAEGVRYGLLVGPFSLAHTFIQYATTPVPGMLVAKWVVAMLVSALVSGVVVSLTYRPAKSQ